MRHSSFTAVYDACVLYPAPLRDFLIRLGMSGRFRARWSAQIHDEWKGNSLLNRPDLKMDQLNRTSDLMDRAIPDTLVTGHENLIAGLTLPDPDDRHVLAPAIRCNASVIVTFNEKDFPAEVLSHYALETQHPDALADNLFDLDQAVVIAAAQRQRHQLKHPPVNVGTSWRRYSDKDSYRHRNLSRIIGRSSELPNATDRRIRKRRDIPNFNARWGRCQRVLHTGCSKGNRGTLAMPAVQALRSYLRYEYRIDYRHTATLPADCGHPPAQSSS